MLATEMQKVQEEGAFTGARMRPDPAAGIRVPAMSNRHKEVPHMAGEVHKTTDHDEIRRWAEERGGEPAQVIGTGAEDEAGILRIQFPEYGDDQNLTAISWEDFFEKFEQERLCFTYQEQLKDGQTSRFSKLVARDA